MKKITLAIILSFVAFMLFGTADASGAEPKRGAYAARQELKKVRRAVDKQTRADKQAQIQERRQRILHNGNINNFYPRAFKVEWIILNDRAYLIFRHYHSYHGYHNRYMRVG